MNPFVSLPDSAPTIATWRRVVLPGLILVLCLAAYVPVLGNGFVSFDDPYWLVQNPALNPPSLANLLRTWTGPYLALYTPLAHTVWYGVSWVGFDGVGLRPLWFHVASVTLHLICVAQVGMLLGRLLPKSGSALPAHVGTALFAVHPMGVEAVAWASGLKDLLAGCLMLGTLLTLPRRPGAGWRQWVLPALCLLLAVVSKPTAVVLPVMMAALLLIDGVPVRRIVWPLAGAGAVVLPFIVLTLRWQPAVAVPDPASAGMRLWVVADTYGFYLAQFALPRWFCIDYARSAGYVASELRFVPHAAVFLVICMGTLLSRDRALLAGLALFILPVAPVSGVVNFDFAAYSVVADHYAYPALPGLALFVARLIQLLIERRPSLTTAVSLTALLVIGFLSTRTFLQARTWQSSESLYRHGVSVSPRSVLMNSNLASLLLEGEKPKPAESLVYSEAALGTWPGHPYSHYNAGRANLLLRRYEAALEHFNAAAPSFASKSSAFHYDVGVALLALGYPRDAAANFWETLRLNPKHPAAAERLREAESRILR